MNEYEYELVDGTVGWVYADYYKKVGTDYVFFRKEKGKDDQDVYHVPGQWLVRPIKMTGDEEV